MYVSSNPLVCLGSFLVYLHFIKSGSALLKARDLTRHVLKRRAREATRTEAIEPSY